MRFNPEISYGHVLQVVTIIAAIVVGWMTHESRIAAAEKDILTMQTKDVEDRGRQEDITKKMSEDINRLALSMERVKTIVEQLSQKKMTEGVIE